MKTKIYKTKETLKKKLYFQELRIATLCRRSLEGMNLSDGNLFSAGFKLTAHLGNFLWLPYDCRIGFSYDYNGGNAVDMMKNGGCPVDSHHFGFVFDINL